MNKFAGSITFKGNVDVKIDEKDFYFAKTYTTDGNSNIYFYGETKLTNKDELVDALKKASDSEVLDVDISLDPADRVEILSKGKVAGEYNFMTIEGVMTDFVDVLEGFADGEDVVAVREAEISSRFGEKVIKIDTIVPLG